MKLVSLLSDQSPLLAALSRAAIGITRPPWIIPPVEPAYWANASESTVSVPVDFAGILLPNL